MTKRELSPKETIILQELEELCVSCQNLSQRLTDNEKALQDKEKELSCARREITRLKEENQHQKEVLQTWKKRLEVILDKLPKV
ncbi:MAG: hypothetical protein GX278_03460 [Aeromonadales bacterium]|nr:hypothetical protein [Aeromonadales bacterium]